MKLYSYFRSSAAYRVRIALNLKGLAYEYAPIHLLRDGGEQLKPDYRELNPDGIVPTFIDGDNVLTQSLAIIEYLEETHPEPPLLPGTPLDRAFVRSVALQIACEIHPVDNLRVLKYLKHTLKVDNEAKDAWYRHWLESGFESLEKRLANDSRVGKLCFGNTPRSRICASCRKCSTRSALISI